MISLVIIDDVTSAPPSPHTPPPSTSPPPPHPPPVLVLIQLMKDPVLFMADGQTYDRVNIEKWVKEKGTSPSSNKHVDPTMRQVRACGTIYYAMACSADMTHVYTEERRSSLFY